MQRFRCNSARYSPPVSVRSIPAVPTQPKTHKSLWWTNTNSTNNTNSTWCVDSPTDFTEFTEPLAREEPPTDCTDFHRCCCLGRGSHGIHGSHRTFCWEEANTNNSNSPWRIGSPTDCTDRHRLLGCVDAPTESTDANFRGCTHFCEIRGFCGRFTQPNHLCRSVKSVGEYSQQEGSVCGFRGRTYAARSGFRGRTIELILNMCCGHRCEAYDYRIEEMSLPHTCNGVTPSM